MRVNRSRNIYGITGRLVYDIRHQVTSNPYRRVDPTDGSFACGKTRIIDSGDERSDNGGRCGCSECCLECGCTSEHAGVSKDDGRPDIDVQCYLANRLAL